MNRATCCTGGLMMLWLMALAGCQSSIFNPDLGSRFHLPALFGGTTQVPNPPDSLDGPDTGRAQVKATTDQPPGPDSLEAHLAAGRDAFSQSRHTAAASHLQAVLKQQPQHVEAHHLMAIITGRQRDYTASDQHFETAIAAEPENANLLSDYGYLKLKRFDLQTAESLLRRALKIEPRNSFALNNLGTVLARQGRYDDALDALRQAGSESEAQAKIAQLFPKGRPAINDTAANTAANTAAPPITADSPRSLPELTGNGLPPQREIQDASTAATLPDVPLVPSAFGQSPAPSTSTAAPNPLTASNTARELIPAPAADLPSRPIPWNSSSHPLEVDSGPITPAAATRPSRRINPEFSLSAARLGLGIGPGSLVPGHTAANTAANTATVPPNEISFPAQPLSRPPALAPIPSPPAASGNAIDPLTEFERELLNNSDNDRDALRRRLNPPAASDRSIIGPTRTSP